MEHVAVRGHSVEVEHFEPFSQLRQISILCITSRRSFRFTFGTHPRDDSENRKKIQKYSTAVGTLLTGDDVTVTSSKMLFTENVHLVKAL